MKIALLSFHNALNYGAALQAFALQDAIESMGEEAEYIDYVNETREAAYNMSKRARNAFKQRDYIRAILNIIGAPLMDLRRRNFSSFYNSRLKKTSKRYTNSAEARELNNKYDMFIVGSDQVWNPENTGSDSAFLLDFAINKKRISYSSSFGITDIPDNLKNTYTNNLLKFNAIAVRETDGIRIVKELTGKDATLVLDPVFLISRKKWQTIEKKNKDRPYIFYYLSSKSQIDAFELNSGLKSYKRHILASRTSLVDFFNPKNRMVISCSPEEFLGEIDCGSYIVTDSFHCTALSIIFHKNFWVYLSGDQGKDERILSILNITGLTDRIIKPDRTPEDIQRKIDYSQVDIKLYKFIERSKGYLCNALYGMEKQEVSAFFNEETRVNTQYFCLDTRCTGCMSCFQSCPQKAISQTIDSDGFYHPVRNENLCNDCGLCHKVCPVFSKPNEQIGQQEYWAFIGDEQIRSQSTSGGIFTYLSDKIIDDNGVIIAPMINSDFHLLYGIAETKDERNKMRGTYYVQCKIDDAYIQTKKYLSTGKDVLFVGTPCYCAGLRKYLQKDYSNLVICDLVCHGVGSPQIFNSFIDALKSKGKLTSYKCRDKELGWRGYTNSCIIDDRKYKDNTWVQSYDNMFSHNLINRLSCSTCVYSSFDRVGDITIGDLWSNSKKIKTSDRKNGISLVICNTPKGKQLFQSIQGAKKVHMEKAEIEQNSLLRPSNHSGHRIEALWTFNTKGYSVLSRKYGGQNMKGMLMVLVRKVLLR